MSKNVKIAPSILSADFACMGNELKMIKEVNADWVHVDVMDGHFVPNMTFGPPIIKKLRPHSEMVFDVHLMIAAPERWLEQYKDAGADRITFHIEACSHAHRYLSVVKQMGLAAGITLNPQTPVSAIEYVLDQCDQVLIMSVNPGFGGQSFIENSLKKIEELRKIIDKRKLDVEIEVDGGINLKNAQRIVKAGADILVMGSAFFSADDRKELVEKIQSLEKN